MGSDLIDAVSSGSEVTVRCNNDVLGTVVPQFSASSEINALVIAGTAVPIPGVQPPNTSIAIPGLASIVLNEQKPTDCLTTPTSAKCTVSALHATVLPPGGPLVELILSNAYGEINFDPATCVCNGPSLTTSSKQQQVLNPDGTDKASGIPNPGDKIRYTINAVNGGCASGTGLTITDRIPNGVTVDVASIPAGSSLGTCPGTLEFTGCPASAASDQCLTIPADTIDAGETQSFSFTVTVNTQPPGGCDQNGFGPDICNSANIKINEIPGIERSSTIMCPNPGTPTPTPTGPTPTPTQTGTPSTPTPTRTGTPPTATPTQSGGGDGDGDGDDGGGDGLGRGRCIQGQGGLIRVVETADPVIPPSSTGSGGAIVFSHTCTGATVRLSSITVGLSGHPELLAAIAATAHAREVTQTVTVSPVGDTAVFNFPVPLRLFANVHETADVSFSLTTGALTSALTNGRGTQFASRFPGIPGGMNPFGAGIAFLGAGIVLMPLQGKKRALLVLLLGLVVLASSPLACGGDGSSKPTVGAADSVTLQVVQVTVFDGSNRPINMSGLPAMLGTVTVR